MTKKKKDNIQLTTSRIREVYHCKLYKYKKDNKEVIMNNVMLINSASWVK